MDGANPSKQLILSHPKWNGNFLVWFHKKSPCTVGGLSEGSAGYQKSSFQFVFQDFDLGITGGSGRALATDVATWTEYRETKGYGRAIEME